MTNANENKTRQYFLWQYSPVMNNVFIFYNKNFAIHSVIKLSCIHKRRFQVVTFLMKSNKNVFLDKNHFMRRFSLFAQLIKRNERMLTLKG